MAVVSRELASAVCVPVRERSPRRRHKREPLAPGDRLGAWRVDAQLGRGGMGTVYAVTHCGFGKRAALKLCHKHVLSAQFTVDTFLREARIVHLIDHAGVADVFATGTYDGRPYLAMERLHGESLGSYLETRAVSREHGLDVLFEVARVLEAAHAAGVVHRDLKLDNVFVLDRAAGSPLQIKLLDWGVARIVGEDDPMKGLIAGTLTYIAPEQIRADDITPAGDIYALGVLAYQLLLGEPPFAHANDLELIRMHLVKLPPRPSTLWTRIPDDLEQLLIAMLDKDPAHRPAIDEVLGGLASARRALTRRTGSPGLLARLLRLTGR